jgi:disulfide bond formation protein DsbB
MQILSRKATYLLAQLNVLVLCGVLLGGFFVQFVQHELPCPLCYMQRLCMMLCGAALLSIVISVRARALTSHVLTTGFGLVILVALLGAGISTRHILLHIVPPDPGFGDPVLGVHLYTWGLLVFVAEILSSALILLCQKQNLEPETALKFGRGQLLTAGMFAAVVSANMLSVFAEAGLHFTLPSDPVKYLLFK